MDYLEGEAAELDPPSPSTRTYTLRLQGFRVALIPLSLPSPTDPKTSPGFAGPGEHPPKLFPEIQAWKTGVGLQVLARSPIHYPAGRITEECEAEEDLWIWPQRWRWWFKSGLFKVCLEWALHFPSRPSRALLDEGDGGKEGGWILFPITFSTLKTLPLLLLPNPGSYTISFSCQPFKAMYCIYSRHSFGSLQIF